MKAQKVTDFKYMEIQFDGSDIHVDREHNALYITNKSIILNSVSPSYEIDLTDMKNLKINDYAEEGYVKLLVELKGAKVGIIGPEAKLKGLKDLLLPYLSDINEDTRKSKR